jgi:hypothetical protein
MPHGTHRDRPCLPRPAEPPPAQRTRPGHPRAGAFEGPGPHEPANAADFSNRRIAHGRLPGPAGETAGRLAGCGTGQAGAGTGQAGADAGGVSAGPGGARAVIARRKPEVRWPLAKRHQRPHTEYIDINSEKVARRRLNDDITRMPDRLRFGRGQDELTLAPGPGRSRGHAPHVERCAPGAMGVIAQNTTVCAQRGARPVFLSRAIPTRHR